MENKVFADANTQDVGEAGKHLSIAVGASILAFTAKKHPLATLALAAAGFCLYRGITGYCPLTEGIKKIKERRQNEDSTGREGDTNTANS
jgi:hypothetical protein